jgi:hypothetical protein
MAEPTAGRLPALAPVLAGHDLAVLGACSAGSRSRPGTPLGQALTAR